MSEPVWLSVLDKVYEVKVERTGERTGELTVVNTETKEVLLREETGLSYGAIFGPDVGDVDVWQEKAVNAVDKANPKGTLNEPDIA